MRDHGYQRVKAAAMYRLYDENKHDREERASPEGSSSKALRISALQFFVYNSHMREDKETK